MSRKSVVLCPTPDEYCSGGKLQTDQHFGHKKCHGNSDEAFKCYRNYLVNVLHYIQVGNREFQETEDSPVLVLTKKIRFGGRLRTGKEGQRFMPGFVTHNKKDNRGIVY